MQILERLGKGESVRDYAYRVLKYNIITFQLIPGSMVSESELASELGISRTPVREALMELAKVNLVEIFPQKGSRISRVNYALVEEANFMRFVLERAIVEMACDIVATDSAAARKWIEQAGENLRLQEFYLERSSASKLLELDNDFHRQLFELCDKMHVFYLMSSMMVHFDRVRSLSLVAVKDTKIVSDHSVLYDAIKAHDKERAVRMITKHLTRFRLDEEVIRKEYPDYID